MASLVSLVRHAMSLIRAANYGNGVKKLWLGRNGVAPIVTRRSESLQIHAKLGFPTPTCIPAETQRVLTADDHRIAFAAVRVLERRETGCLSQRLGVMRLTHREIHV
jgi:hypothetical protein